MNKWTHNVQLVRLEMPASSDIDHHDALVAFNKDLELLMLQHFGGHSVVSYIGFYRADKNWDNIEQDGRCINSPSRGFNKDGVDNEP